MKKTWIVAAILVIIFGIILYIIGAQMASPSTIMSSSINDFEHAYNIYSSGGTVETLGILVVIIGCVVFLAGAIIKPKLSSDVNESALKKDRRCPKCGRVIPDDAVICPFCKKDFEGFKKS